MRKVRKPRESLEQNTIRYGLNAAVLESVRLFITQGVAFEGGTRELITFLQSSRSSLERRWQESGRAEIEKKFGPVCVMLYEWVSFKLPGGSYTPDFNYLLADGCWVHVEVKGSRMQSNYRDARSKLRAASTLNPWYTFVEVRPEKGGMWTLEVVKPDPDYLAGLIGA